MGVIGRLDDQVNEIIIKPVGARREAEESRSPQEAPAPQPQPAPEEEAAGSVEKERAEASELPVWLL